MQNEVISNLQKEIEARKALLAFIEEKGLTVERVSSVGLIEANEGYASIEIRFPISDLASERTQDLSGQNINLDRLEEVAQGMLERMNNNAPAA